MGENIFKKKIFVEFPFFDKINTNENIHII